MTDIRVDDYVEISYDGVDIDGEGTIDTIQDNDVYRVLIAESPHQGWPPGSYQYFGAGDLKVVGKPVGYVPFKSAREEAIAVIRVKASEILTVANTLSADKRTTGNWVAVSAALNEIADEIEEN